MRKKASKIKRYRNLILKKIAEGRGEILKGRGMPHAEVVKKTANWQ